MLHIIKDLSDFFFKILTDDPVRPNIPHETRIGKNRDVFVLKAEENKVGAVTCVSYQSTIPESETKLFEICDEPNTAVFYTIWSYESGKGRQLILDSVKYITENNKSINRFVTLSPKTEMARKFHLKNGARVFRENLDTVNYEYIIR